MPVSFVRKARNNLIRANDINELQAAAENLDSSLTTEKAKIAEVNPPTSANPGKIWVQGQQKGEWDDMPTVVYDHLKERSLDGHENRIRTNQVLNQIGEDQVRLFFKPEFDEYGNVVGIPYSRETGGEVRVLDIPSNTVLEGTFGSCLKVADGQPKFTRILNAGREGVTGKKNITIRGLLLDGNKDNNEHPGTGIGEDTHHAAIFGFEVDRLTIEDVEVINFTGDAVQLTGGSTDLTRNVNIRRLRATGNLRNPVTVEQADEVLIDESYLMCDVDSLGQAVDSEPYADIAVGRLRIRNSVLGHENPDKYVLTVGGKNGTYPRRNIEVENVDFRGGVVYIVFAEDILFVKNRGYINRLYAPGHVKRMIVDDNDLEILTSTNYAMNFEWSFSATPEAIRIGSKNILRMPNGGGGYRFAGARKSSIEGGHLIGTGDNTGRFGISVTAVQNMVDISAIGTMLENWHQPFRASPSGANTLDGLKVGDFVIDESGSGVAAVDLYSASAWLSNVVVLSSAVRNAATTPFTIHTSTPYVVAGTPGCRAHWICNGDPNGQIAERIGALATDAATGNLWRKTTGTTTPVSSGWVNP